MRVLFAPDSFKGTITAAEVAAALAEGWRSECPGAYLVAMPLADGGEGTLDAFAAAVTGAIRMPVTVTGPDDQPHEASWLLLPPTADAPRGTGVIELASTSGIELLTELRPWSADTSGCGEAIAAAIEHGVSRVIVGIGSSSSTDGGSGIMRALGARLLDADGREAAPGANGLADIASIDITAMRVPEQLLVVTDVRNPLTGPSGAAAVFGTQKGLAAGELEVVDARLKHFARIVVGALGPERVSPDAPGTGAAGGAGFALLALGGELLPGAAEIARLMGFSEELGAADVVVTGEGSYDGQSGAGKVPGFVAEAARGQGIGVAVVAGRIDESADLASLDAAMSLTEIAGSSEAAMADPRPFLVEAGRRLARQFQ